jgi:hypothetical protein
VLRLYENSLSMGLFLLFALSLVLHAVAGAREYSQQKLAHGGYAVTMVRYLRTSQL